MFDAVNKLYKLPLEKSHKIHQIENIKINNCSNKIESSNALQQNAKLIRNHIISTLQNCADYHSFPIPLKSGV